MLLTVLGSGTLVPDRDRTGAAYWIEDHETRLLLDCGTGTLHGFGRYGISWPKLTHIALSHFHHDHVGDVAAVLFALKNGLPKSREAPLTILGPPGTARFLRRVESAFGRFVRDPGFPLRVVELEREGCWDDDEVPWALSTFPTPHSEHSIAYRWEGTSGSVGYTGDTGPSPELAVFLEGVDLLISECAASDPTTSDTHLSPKGVAWLADRAQPRLLLLSHMYPPLSPATAPRLVADAGYRGEVATAWDGTVVELRRGAGARIIETGRPVGIADSLAERNPD